MNRRRRRPNLLLATPLLALAAGCSSTKPYEDRIRELTWKLDAAELAAEQATVDARLSERERGLALQKAKALQEQLALSYDALRDARAQLDSTLHDRLTELSNGGNTGAGQLEISQYGGIVLDGGVFFASGSHTLTKAGEAALAGMIAILRRPDYAEYEIELAGHSDADKVTRTAGKYRDNFDLAALRANSVRRHLIEQGVDEARLYLSSWGPNHPISGADKAKTRRVEILLHKRDGETTVPASSPREASAE